MKVLIPCLSRKMSDLAHCAAGYASNGQHGNIELSTLYDFTSNSDPYCVNIFCNIIIIDMGLAPACSSCDAGAPDKG